jgi:hypothetical protein
MKATEIDLKADLIAEAYGLVGIDAMVVGEGDLALGLEKVKGLAARYKLPILAGNLDCGGTKPFPGHVVVERGGWRFGFVGVVPAEVKVEGCTVADPQEAAASEVAALGKVDVVVALGSFDADSGKTLVEKVPSIDFVIAGGQGTVTGVRSVGTGKWILGTGSQGKKLGVLTGTAAVGSKGWRDQDAGNDVSERLDGAKKRLEGAKKRLEEAGDDEQAKSRVQRQIDAIEKQIPDLEKEVAAARSSSEGTSSTFKNKLVDLGTHIPDHEATMALVTATKAKLETAGVSTTRAEPPTAQTLPMPEIGPFIGVMACRNCHQPEFDQWKSSPHAHAFATLVRKKAQREEGCYSCHVTGAGEPGGPTGPDTVGSFINVGCEACHGGGRAHTDNPQANRLPSKVDPEVCLECHGQEGDPGHYDQATYWPKILHHKDEPAAKP